MEKICIKKKRDWAHSTKSVSTSISGKLLEADRDKTQSVKFYLHSRRGKGEVSEDPNLRRKDSQRQRRESHRLSERNLRERIN